MTRLSKALASLLPMMLLTVAAAAETQTPDRRLSVFVTAAPLGGPVDAYGPVSPDELAEPLEAVTLAIEGEGRRADRKHLRLVDSAADAHIVVTIRSRRAERIGFGLFSRYTGILYAITPGPKVAAARFASIPADRGARQGQAAPELQFEVFKNAGMPLIGALVAKNVDGFSKKHAVALLESASDAP